jgi:hypothetical protein
MNAEEFQTIAIGDLGPSTFNHGTLATERG